MCRKTVLRRLTNDMCVHPRLICFIGPQKDQRAIQSQEVDCRIPIFYLKKNIDTFDYHLTIAITDAQTQEDIDWITEHQGTFVVS